MTTTDEYTIRIQDLTTLALTRVLSGALSSPDATPDIGLLSDFLAAIDWSGAEAEGSVLAPDIGELQALLVEFSEGDLPLASLKAGIIGMLFRLGGNAEVIDQLPTGFRIQLSEASPTEATSTGSVTQTLGAAGEFVTV